MKDDDIQNAICTHCEDTILGCKHSTSTFLCEGRYCDQAEDSFYANNEQISIEDLRKRAQALLIKDSGLRQKLKDKLNGLGSQNITNLDPKYYYDFSEYMKFLMSNDDTNIGQFNRNGQILKEDFKKEYPLTPSECFMDSTDKTKQKQIFLLSEFEPIRVSEYKETNINF